MHDFVSFAIASIVEAGQPTAGPLGELTAKFGVNWKYLVAQMLNFGIVAVLLYRFAFRPIVATLDERQEKISEGLRMAEEVKVQLVETNRRQEEILSQARQEAQQLLAEARATAKNHQERQFQETSARIEDMFNKAHQANELERQKMLAEVRMEITRLVILTSGVVLKKALTPEEKNRLADLAGKELASLS